MPENNCENKEGYIVVEFYGKARYYIGTIGIRRK